MALQSSGAISISQIKAELGSSSYSLRTLSSEAGKSTPDAMSEFYGYSATTVVNIDFTYPTYCGCANYYSFEARSSIAVSTNLTITMYWYGDLGGAFNGNVTIYSGDSCGGNGSVYSGGAVNCYGEYLSETSYYFYTNSGPGQSYVGNNVTNYYVCT